LQPLDILTHINEQRRLVAQLMQASPNIACLMPTSQNHHARTKTKSPQTNGICERFHKTVLNEFYRVAFRKKVYRSINELQADLRSWVRGLADRYRRPQSLK
jgi:hypothetical protein